MARKMQRSHASERFLGSRTTSVLGRAVIVNLARLRQNSWRRIAMVAALPAYGAVYVIGYLFFLKDPELEHVVAGLAFLPLVVVAMAAAFNTARSAASTGSRRAWTFIGFAFVAYTFGNAAWFWIGTVIGEAIPFPSVADIGFLSFFPLLVVGLWLLPRERVRHRLGSALDMALVMVGAGLLIWWSVLEPVARGVDGTTGNVLVALAYPVGDTLVLFVLLAALLARLTETPRTVLSLLAVGLLINVGADLAYARLSLQAGYQTDTWLDLAYMLVWVAMGTAAVVQGTALTHRTAGAKAKALRPITLLPYLAIIAVYVPLAGSAFWGHGGDRVLVGGAILGTALVVGRQIHTSRENAALMALQASTRAAARFQALISNASDVILVTDPAGQISFATPSVEALSGRGPSSVEGTSIADLLDPAEGPKVLALLGAAAARPGISGPSLFQVAGPEAHWVEIRVSNLLDDSLISGLVATIYDVTERRAFEQQLEAQAFQDPLTGLPNRVLFVERVERAVVRARRSRRLPSVLYLDMDDFKRINDTFGHAVGDRVLVEVSRRVQQTIRSEDTAARLGSDEFAVLLDETSDTAEAVALAERLEAAFAAPFEAGGSLFSLLSSIGIVRSGQSRSTSTELLRNAEIAMYAAKRESRGGHLVFQPAMYAETVDRVRLDADLRQALDRGELQLVYQPIVALADGDLRGVEALLRWQHPKRGLVMPIEFISLAEGSGEIRRIGAWVLGEACRTVGGWNAMYLGTRITANVNVSVGQLVPEFIAQVAGILAETGFEASQLVLEITESVFSDDRNEVVEILRGLRGLGVRISIDDFGTGYSSLSRLRDLPVDELKVDRSFINQLGGDLNKSFVSTILRLANELSLQTVAEGIEETEQKQILIELGCELGQGYLIARPTEPAHFEEMLASRGLLRRAA
jgi:diguanylate cyclase (GGDEF)-like protein/PAS domain S-box-containing protein